MLWRGPDPCTGEPNERMLDWCSATGLHARHPPCTCWPSASNPRSSPFHVEGVRACKAQPATVTWSNPDVGYLRPVKACARQERLSVGRRGCAPDIGVSWRCCAVPPEIKAVILGASYHPSCHSPPVPVLQPLTTVEGLQFTLRSLLEQTPPAATSASSAPER